jgi:hypothetical protein
LGFILINFTAHETIRAVHSISFPAQEEVYIPEVALKVALCAVTG